MEVGEEGSEEGGEGVDKADLGGGEVLEAVKFADVCQINTKKAQDSEGEELPGGEF